MGIVNLRGVYLVALTVLALGGLALWWAVQRGTELFVLDVTHGRVRLVRGRLPPRLLADLGDVLARPPVKQGTVVAQVEGQAPRLKVRGDIDAGRLQRLRNVMGGYPVAKIRNGSARR